MRRLSLAAGAALASLLAGCGATPSPPAQPPGRHAVEFIFLEAREGDETSVAVDDAVLFRGKLQQADPSTAVSGRFKHDLTHGARRIVWSYEGETHEARVDVKPSTRFIYFHAIAPVPIEASDLPALD